MGVYIKDDSFENFKSLALGLCLQTYNKGELARTRNVKSTYTQRRRPKKSWPEGGRADSQKQGMRGAAAIEERSLPVPSQGWPLVSLSSRGGARSVSSLCTPTFSPPFFLSFGAAGGGSYDFPSSHFSPDPGYSFVSQSETSVPFT